MFRLLRKPYALYLLTFVGPSAVASFPAHVHADDKQADQYEIGLSMYSLRQLFKSGDLHVHDYPDFAKKTFGITKIDVWTGGYPKGWQNDPNFLPELKRRADAAGADIFLVMAGTVNATPTDENALKKNALRFKSYVDQAEILGSDFVRIFVKVDNQASDDESIRRASIALRALSDYAQPKGVTIAIEPTPKSTPLGSYLAKLVATTNHPNCRLMPDFGKMQGTDIYQGTKDMMPYSVSISAKGHDFNEDGSQKDFDYPRLMKIIREAGYTGIVAIEYEGNNLDPIEGVKAMQLILKKCTQ